MSNHPMNWQRRYILLTVTWTSLVIGSLCWCIYQEKQAAIKAASASALTNIHKDISFRKWATSHGGVYVPPTEHTPPNPYLHIPDRDVVTTTGKKLTLMNPAYALREMQNDFPADYGTRTHITSLELLNPNNAPDAWETAALHRFRRGEKQVMEIVAINGQPHIRLMQPFVVEQACLKCHSQQGYKVGDIRGGISATVTMQPYLEHAKQLNQNVALSHLTIWLFGLTILFFTYKRDRRQEQVQQQAKQQLQKSAEEIEDLYNRAPCGYHSLDRNGIVVRINNTELAWLGYSREEILNKIRFIDLLTPNSKLTFQENFPKFLQTGSITGLVFDVICKNGNTLPILVNATAIYDNKGKFLMCRSSLFDITELKRTEAALRQERDFADNLIETAQAIILLLDTQGRILRYNSYLEKLSGYPLAEMQGKDWITSFLPEHEQQRIRQLFHTATSGTPTKANINPILTRSGEERQIEWFDKTLLDSNGNTIGLLAVGQDVTQRIATEKELKQYREHLETEVQIRTADLVLARDAADAANKAKSAFLANMSHELRTPLNAILGFSNLMRQDSSLTEAQNKNLDIINRSGTHLLSLINDVLELAKIEAGRTQLHNTAFDLGALVRNVIDMMEIRAHSKGLQLILDQSSEFPRYIYGDEARLRQVLINLIGNAIKFTQKGGVTLRLASKPNSISHLIIEVEDSGPGISTEDQQHLFQPFVQLGKQAADNQGSGLGLAITQQFVQLMGGTISLQSKLGTGSLFRVELPLQETSTSDLIEPQASEHGEVIGLAPNQSNYRILIVEDQIENQLLLSKLIQRLGFDCKIAANGAEGIQIFQDWQPHLIFMDRRMPIMDGIQATQQIRLLPGGKTVKIIAVTASAFVEQRDEILKAGMDDFVRKPYRFNEIYDMLHQHLGVQYIYAGIASETAPPPLTHDMLSVLPSALRAELGEALNSLDEERIQKVLVQCATYDADLHQTLAQLIDNFDYPTILQALA